MTAVDETSDDLPASAFAPPDRPPITAIDPRTKLVALIVINSVSYTSGSISAQCLSALVVAILLATTRNAKVLGGYGLIFALSELVYLGLPLVASGPLVATVAAIGFWVSRFAITIGFFGYLFLTTSVSDFVAALSAIRLPRFVIIPLAVVLRFIPTVIDELHAIIDAMRLRGVILKAGNAVAHPVHYAQYILLPLLASTTRIADEISASALIRGLGRSKRPTSIQVLRFGLPDLLLLVCAAGIVVATKLGARFW